MTKPVLLLILDGWGHRVDTKDNGIELAKKPYFDSLKKDYPHSLIDGSGPAVGLPEGIMGNSEVGHMNLGAGRIVYSGLSQIYQAIDDGTFASNEALQKAIQHVKKTDGCLHLFGLLSDGAVHSHQDHLYALLSLAKSADIKKVMIHCFMDGRDTPPEDGKKYLQQLQNQIEKIGVGNIASISGRFFAMDRDSRWDRVEKAFHAMCGRSAHTTEDVISYVESCYENGQGDEFVEPATVVKDGEPIASITKDDAFIFFNFRADRARQITRAFTEKEFKGFDRGDQPLPAVYVCAAPYDSNFDLPVAFCPSYPKEILGELLAKEGKKQLRIAETEKYAHVTFFFNGGQDQVFEGEDRVLIPSPKEVATYDLKPEMSAHQVADELIERIKSEKYDLIVCNFANADMVGHTAMPEAIFKAIETVDDCLAKVLPALIDKGGVALVTADHGNAELMVDRNGEPMTAHTTNLVPFIVVGSHAKNWSVRDSGRLCDVAPTILKLLDLPQPSAMTGENLIHFS